MTRPSPPSGAPPPQVVRLDDGATVALGPLVDVVADRYYHAYPDEHRRYGPVGREWCIHDNLYLLAWAYAAHRGDVGVLEVRAVVDRRRAELDGESHPRPRPELACVDAQAEPGGPPGLEHGS